MIEAEQTHIIDQQAAVGLVDEAPGVSGRTAQLEGDVGVAVGAGLSGVVPQTGRGAANEVVHGVLGEDELLICKLL